MKTKAIALMSGGLDSSLAVRLIHDMGIEIIGVHFTGPFCMCNRGAGGCIHYAREQADKLGINFSTRPLGKQYLEIVKHPKHGYGSGINPCLDCRIMMFKQAGEMMREHEASFIMTGEVLGQRPMSQLRQKIALIESESGLKRMILRPLSAQHFEPTFAEETGLVDRAKLLGLEGRRRRPQMDLAEKLAIGDYPCPAGGCLLTDKHFAKLLREHIDQGELVMSDIALLKLGRHFRLSGGSKLVIGRDQEENNKLEQLAGTEDIVITPKTVMGPTGLMKPVAFGEAELERAGSIIASYCDGEDEVDLICRVQGAETEIQCQRAVREKLDLNEAV